MFDTPENRKELQMEVDDMNADIKAGVFQFEIAFPDASIEKKRKFSQLEQRALKHNATSVTFEMGHKRWEQKCFPNLANDSIKRDHESAMSLSNLSIFQGVQI